MFIGGLWRRLFLLTCTVTAAATNHYGANRNRKAVCKASYEIDANDNLLRDRKKREKHKKNKEYALFTNLEKHKNNKEYTFFNTSNYRSLGLVDMSTPKRKWFSMVPDFPEEEDSIYKPFIKKVRKVQVHDFSLFLGLLQIDDSFREGFG